jgi:hypothetical protein
MGRRGFDRMRSPRAAAMIALASATRQARTLPANRTSAGGMLPCSMQFAGTRGNQGNSNGVNRGHEFTVQPIGESFGWQGRAR